MAELIEFYERLIFVLGLMAGTGWVGCWFVMRSWKKTIGFLEGLIDQIAEERRRNEAARICLSSIGNADLKASIQIAIEILEGAEEPWAVAEQDEDLGPDPEPFV